MMQALITFCECVLVFVFVYLYRDGPIFLIVDSELWQGKGQILGNSMIL